jgi:hypothetical protein
MKLIYLGQFTSGCSWHALHHFYVEKLEKSIFKSES